MQFASQIEITVEGLTGAFPPYGFFGKDLDALVHPMGVDGEELRSCETVMFNA